MIDEIIKSIKILRASRDYNIIANGMDSLIPILDGMINEDKRRDDRIRELEQNNLEQNKMIMKLLGKKFSMEPDRVLDLD